ncbi:threonine dehydratase [Roseibium hamelinense]|uniref:Threonine dehydratase n=1 Tax=Roseibium hamelinense TaxID=150831 RepID=A0A562SM63_9HYPH|nr:hydroxyectoine utilization dehydratase EutB [Roseibium hamelinense]MTI45095.1 hydroxyectoine utilization dehydratase EutB [Roseibium hamelinense]TWI82362.1 threonine dehydratase [Roseibium hamelinense]
MTNFQKERCWLKDSKIRLQDIYMARQRIHGRVNRTPLVKSDALSQLCGAEVLLKLEHQQRTGSFKLRGATNAIVKLSDEEREKGIVGASTGNHGRGLAYAAARAGARCVICMSRLVPENKVAAIRDLGAEVRIVGSSQDDAQEEVDRLVVERGMTMLPPFDHPDVIAGQGTLGLEILEDAPQVDTVLIPLSGGGLISGIALAMKSANPSIRVFGISMDRGAAMIASINAGKPVKVEEYPSLADSLGGGIGLENKYTFNMVRDLVDQCITVDEAQIAAAVRHAYWEEQQVIEGAGSVGIAALLSKKIHNPGRCIVLLSGSNIDMALHKRLIDGENVDLSST